jgi:hypothetical protein
MTVKCQEDKVMYVNGERVGKLGFPLSVKGELVWDFLNLRGSEGWEMITALRQGQSPDPATFVLKRPLPLEE